MLELQCEKAKDNLIIYFIKKTGNYAWNVDAFDKLIENAYKLHSSKKAPSMEEISSVGTFIKFALRIMKAIEHYTKNCNNNLYLSNIVALLDPFLN